MTAAIRGARASIKVMTILDIRMHDGSRHFGSLPESVSVTEPDIERLRAQVQSLRGAKLVNVLTDHVTEAWIDFSFEGHRFTMNNQCNDWWFFVTNPACPEPILHSVLAHFSTLLTQG